MHSFWVSQQVLPRSGLSSKLLKFPAKHQDWHGTDNTSISGNILRPVTKSIVLIPKPEITNLFVTAPWKMPTALPGTGNTFGQPTTPGPTILALPINLTFQEQQIISSNARQHTWVALLMMTDCFGSLPITIPMGKSTLLMTRALY